MTRITTNAAALTSAVQMLQDHIEEAPNDETKAGVIALGEALDKLYYGNAGNMLTIEVSR
jgi:hypothetical protein